MINFNQIPSPCYILDSVLLEKNLQKIKKVAEEANVEIIQAFKSFAMWSAFPLMKKYFDKAAASSLNEARLAFEELKTKVHTYSPAYTETDFEEIKKYSSHITFNSINQYKKFSEKIKDTEISAALRINPEYSPVSTELYNSCARGSRLGITAEELNKDFPVGIEGLHFHNLCESSAEELDKTLKIVEDKFSAHLHKIKWINMGGGHLITHKDYNTKLLVSTLKKFRKKYNINIILEPGSAFTWQTGYLLATIVDITNSSGIKTAILDISFTAHAPDCLEMPYKPKIKGAMSPRKELPTYRMGGNSCLAGDYLGDWSFPEELKEGDKIIFEDMIHYTMVKTNMFNGVNHPSIGIWHKDNKFELVRKFSYEDYKNRLS